ncbi:unnamed protein product [Closterium sp. NIES-54]
MHGGGGDFSFSVPPRPLRPARHRRVRSDDGYLFDHVMAAQQAADPRAHHGGNPQGGSASGQATSNRYRQHPQYMLSEIPSIEEEDHAAYDDASPTGESVMVQPVSQRSHSYSRAGSMGRETEGQGEREWERERAYERDRERQRDAPVRDWREGERERGSGRERGGAMEYGKGREREAEAVRSRESERSGSWKESEKHRGERGNFRDNERTGGERSAGSSRERDRADRGTGSSRERGERAVASGSVRERERLEREREREREYERGRESEWGRDDSTRRELSYEEDEEQQGHYEEHSRYQASQHAHAHQHYQQPPAKARTDGHSSQHSLQQPQQPRQSQQMPLQQQHHHHSQDGLSSSPQRHPMPRPSRSASSGFPSPLAPAAKGYAPAPSSSGPTPAHAGEARYGSPAGPVAALKQSARHRRIRSEDASMFHRMLAQDHAGQPPAMSGGAGSAGGPPPGVRSPVARPMTSGAAGGAGGSRFQGGPAAGGAGPSGSAVRGSGYGGNANGGGGSMSGGTSTGGSGVTRQHVAARGPLEGLGERFADYSGGGSGKERRAQVTHRFPSSRSVSAVQSHAHDHDRSPDSPVRATGAGMRAGAGAGGSQNHKEQVGEMGMAQRDAQAQGMGRSAGEKVLMRPRSMKALSSPGDAAGDEQSLGYGASAQKQQWQQYQQPPPQQQQQWQQQQFAPSPQQQQQMRRRSHDSQSSPWPDNDSPMRSPPDVARLSFDSADHQPPRAARVGSPAAVGRPAPSGSGAPRAAMGPGSGRGSGKGDGAWGGAAEAVAGRVREGTDIRPQALPRPNSSGGVRRAAGVAGGGVDRSRSTDGSPDPGDMGSGGARGGKEEGVWGRKAKGKAGQPITEEALEQQLKLSAHRLSAVSPAYSTSPPHSPPRASSSRPHPASSTSSTAGASASPAQTSPAASRPAGRNPPMRMTARSASGTYFSSAAAAVAAVGAGQGMGGEGDMRGGRKYGGTGDSAVGGAQGGAPMRGGGGNYGGGAGSGNVGGAAAAVAAAAGSGGTNRLRPFEEPTPANARPKPRHRRSESAGPGYFVGGGGIWGAVAGASMAPNLGANGPQALALNFLAGAQQSDAVVSSGGSAHARAQGAQGKVGAGAGGTAGGGMAGRVGSSGGGRDGASESGGAGATGGGVGSAMASSMGVEAVRAGLSAIRTGGHGSAKHINLGAFANQGPAAAATTAAAATAAAAAAAAAAAVGPDGSIPLSTNLKLKVRGGMSISVPHSNTAVSPRVSSSATAGASASTPTHASPRSGINSPFNMASPREGVSPLASPMLPLDPEKLWALQNFQRSTPVSTPTASPRPGSLSPPPAAPPRTPNVSDYYYSAKSGEGGSPRAAEEEQVEETPATANVLLKDVVELSELYRLSRKELGRGNFGVIRVCEKRDSGERFACKTIEKKNLECWEDVEDVRREVQVMEMLRDHANVIKLVDTVESQKEVHLIMELCEGGELFDRIQDKGYYSERQAAKVTRTVVDVLQHCHSHGVLHRDLKPENILLTSKRSDTRVKVIDYGMAYIFQPGERCTFRAGTPNYIAPEVINKNYGVEADVWSAGVILYILLCGLPPFWGDTTEEIFKSVLWGHLDFDTDPWPQVSDAAKDLVRRMLCKNYAKRITVEAILRHPWIVAYTTDETCSWKNRFGWLRSSSRHFIMYECLLYDVANFRAASCTWLRAVYLPRTPTPSSPTQQRGAVPSLTKVVGTVGGTSRSVEVLEALLRAGMTVARFDFSHGDADYHQHTLDNLRIAMHRTKKLCAVMLDTVGAELIIPNPGGAPITLTAGSDITLSPACSAASASCLPLSFHGLAQGLSVWVAWRVDRHGTYHGSTWQHSVRHPVLPPAHPTHAPLHALPCEPQRQAVRAGDEIFVGQYLFTGAETTSVWLQVRARRMCCHVARDVVWCKFKSCSLCMLMCVMLHGRVTHGCALGAWHQVRETRGADVVCCIRNSTTLAGHFFTAHAARVRRAAIMACSERITHSHVAPERHVARFQPHVCMPLRHSVRPHAPLPHPHASLPCLVCTCTLPPSLLPHLAPMTRHQVRMDIPTLTAADRQHIATWGRRNSADIISLSFTRHPDDVAQTRELLDSLGDLSQTQIYAKVETMQGLRNFEGIAEVADGIILSRGNLGIDVPPEKVFGVQKWAVAQCNVRGKPAVITRVLDSMVLSPRPTRAEATDVANAVLDGGVERGGKKGVYWTRGCGATGRGDAEGAVPRCHRGHCGAHLRSGEQALLSLLLPAHCYTQRQRSTNTAPLHLPACSHLHPFPSPPCPYGTAWHGRRSVCSTTRGTSTERSRRCPTPSRTSRSSAPPRYAAPRTSSLPPLPSSLEPPCGQRHNMAWHPSTACKPSPCAFVSPSHLFGPLSAALCLSHSICSQPPAQATCLSVLPLRASLGVPLPPQVRTAEKVRAAAIIAFTSSGHTARLVCKYKPSMPVLALMVPHVSTDQLSWHLMGPFQAHQCLAVRGLFPILADVMTHCMVNGTPVSMPPSATILLSPLRPCAVARGAWQASRGAWTPEEWVLQTALERAGAMGMVRGRDRVIVVQKIRDAFAVRIVHATPT